MTDYVHGARSFDVTSGTTAVCHKEEDVENGGNFLWSKRVLDDTEVLTIAVRLNEWKPEGYLLYTSEFGKQVQIIDKKVVKNHE